MNFDRPLYIINTKCIHRKITLGWGFTNCSIEWSIRGWQKSNLIYLFKKILDSFLHIHAIFGCFLWPHNMQNYLQSLGLSFCTCISTKQKNMMLENRIIHAFWIAILKKENKFQQTFFMKQCNGLCKSIYRHIDTHVQLC